MMILRDDELRAIVEQIAAVVIPKIEAAIVKTIRDEIAKIRPAGFGSPVKVKKTTKPLGPEDKRYGYTFGVDGVMGLDEAKAVLGGPSRTTIERLAELGSIRKGKNLGRVVFCRRSVEEYVSNCES